MIHARIIGYYSPPSEIELVGTSEAWRNLAKVVSSAHQATTVELYIPQSGPEPFDNFIKSMQIVPKGGYVEIRIKEDFLLISGAPANLEQLAWEFRWLADHPEPSGGIPQHLHIEYVTEPSYLSPSALPLVATIKDDV
jgi:hypothetical protein